MRTLITAAAFALVATSGLAQEATTFDIDRTGEGGMASYEDFNKSFDQLGHYDQLDADGDGMLSREEYNRAVFARFDADEDGLLNDEEIVGMQNDAMFFDMGDEQAEDEAQTNN